MKFGFVAVVAIFAACICMDYSIAQSSLSKNEGIYKRQTNTNAEREKILKRIELQQKELDETFNEIQQGSEFVRKAKEEAQAIRQKLSEVRDMHPICRTQRQNYIRLARRNASDRLVQRAKTQSINCWQIAEIIHTAAAKKMIRVRNLIIEAEKINKDLPVLKTLMEGYANQIAAMRSAMPILDEGADKKENTKENAPLKSYDKEDKTSETGNSLFQQPKPENSDSGEGIGLKSKGGIVLQ